MIYLQMLRAALPYLACAAIGFAPAWWVQGLRIERLKQSHAAYVLKQADEAQAAIDAANKLKDQSDHDYQVSKSKLDEEMQRGEVYRRCVAAGKCGAVVRVQSCSGQAPAPAAAGSADAARPDSVPPAGERAEERSEAPPVVNECAATTLTLNKLQNLVEAQDGY
jgi:hypothetical protein